MKLKKYLRFVGLFVVLGSIAVLGFECPPQAIIVEIGWDLFVTQSALLARDNTILTVGDDAIEFEGVPLVSFNFGGLIGEKDTGLADTIIERLEVAEVAEVGEADTIPIEVVALQLKSKTEIDPDGPNPLEADFLYATLSETQSSTGTMTITFVNENRGTFDSEFTVHFDLRIGGLDGPVIDEGSKTFKSTSARWRRQPPAGAFEIEGVNAFLNGNNRRADFWVIDNVTHDDGRGSEHIVHDQGGGN